MALTLTAAPNATGDAVVLTVAGASTAGPARVSRLDRNGMGTVRLPTGVDPAAGAFALTDYEAALGGAAAFLVVDAAGSSARASASLAGLADLPQLRPTFRPLQGVELTSVLDLAGSAELRQSRHEVLMRPDAVFTTYGLAQRSGTMRLRCADLAAALAVRDVYAGGTVVLLRLPDRAGLDMHHLGLTVGNPEPQPRQADGSRWWDVSVTYAEVEPSAGTALLTWSLGDVDSVYASLAEASLAYATLGDLDANRVATP